MICGNYVEEFLSLQEKIPQQVAIQEKALSEAITAKMVINEAYVHGRIRWNLARNKGTI